MPHQFALRYPGTPRINGTAIAVTMPPGRVHYRQTQELQSISHIQFTWL